MKAIVILLALLASAKLGYQEYLFRGATRDALIGAYREHAVQACQKDAATQALGLGAQGAKVIGPPHPADGKSPYGFYKVDVDTQGNVVKVKTTVAITKSRIPVAEYAAFRAFCEQADRELGQSLTFTVGK